MLGCEVRYKLIHAVDTHASRIYSRHECKIGLKTKEGHYSGTLAGLDVTGQHVRQLGTVRDFLF